MLKEGLETLFRNPEDHAQVMLCKCIPQEIQSDLDVLALGGSNSFEAVNKHDRECVARRRGKREYVRSLPVDAIGANARLRRQKLLQRFSGFIRPIARADQQHECEAMRSLQSLDHALKRSRRHGATGPASSCSGSGVARTIPCRWRMAERSPRAGGPWRHHRCHWALRAVVHAAARSRDV